MAYTVRNAEGEVVAGDAELDDVLKAAAMLVGGSVIDEDTGRSVYVAPPLPPSVQVPALEPDPIPGEDEEPTLEGFEEL